MKKIIIYNLIIVLLFFILFNFIFSFNAFCINKPGKIFISSTPSGAEIYLNSEHQDNEYKGITPQILSEIDPGVYLLILTKPGYKDYIKWVTVSSGKTTYIKVSLVAVSGAEKTYLGAIKITSNPSGASVFLDDSFKNVSPMTIKNLVPGKHLVKITKTGYKEYQQEVTVSSDKTTTINADLFPITSTEKIDKLGKIAISSVPSGASVFLDRTFKGISPMTLKDIAIGKYMLKITKTGYHDYQQKVIVSSDKTTEVLAKLTVIPPSYGKIKVTSTPSSAKIFLDAGQYMGKTPLTLDNISPGKHKVTLVLFDYEKYAEEVEVVSDKTIELSKPLVSTKPKPPSVGKLVLDSTPSSAKVYLNNAYKGTTSLTIDQLKPGDYQLKLSKDGYQDWSKKVTVVPSKTNTLSVSLIALPKPAPVYGQLSVNSTPSDAKVFLNDKPKGTTPLILDELSPGTYHLRLIKEGYQDLKQEVQIKAGETTQITAPLSLVPKKEEPVAKEEDNTYQQFFQQGKNYYTGGLYPEAVQSFRKALSIDDTGWELHYYLGKTYQELEIYNPAIDCYKKAIGIKPQEYEPYFSLGNVYDHVKLYQEAIIAYEKACRINSESDLLYTCLGLAYHHADLISEAIKSHNKAIELNPVNTASFSYLADIYFEKGLYSLAITNYQKSIHINPNNEQLHYKLGKTYYEAGQYPEAVSYLDQAIRINPTYARAYHLLGLTYVALGDNISANKQYEILKKLDNSLAKKLKELIGK